MFSAGGCRHACICPAWKRVKEIVLFAVTRSSCGNAPKLFIQFHLDTLQQHPGRARACQDSIFRALSSFGGDAMPFRLRPPF